jgi:hypothetical protein
MCSEYLPLGAMIAPYGCFDVSSVLLASNDEVVALLVCTILMAGSVLKSAAAQIGPLGANPLQESAWRKN